MKNQTFPWLKLSSCSSLVLAAGFALAAATTGHAQTLLLDLTANNYDNSTGTWSDPTTGNSAAGPAGALVTNSTPNGSSAVGFSGSTTDSFSLTTTIALTAGTTFTIFVYTEPTPAFQYGALISGGGGSLEYRINSDGTQSTEQTSQADEGKSSTALTLSHYNNINAQITLTTGANGTFRLNGSNDGTTDGDSAISGSLTNIGSQDTGSEPFEGNIAAIEVYSGAMTDLQRAMVEASFTAAYVTVPEPSTWATALVGIAALLGVQRLRTRKA